MDLQVLTPNIWPQCTTKTLFFTTTGKIGSELAGAPALFTFPGLKQTQIDAFLLSAKTMPRPQSTCGTLPSTCLMAGITTLGEESFLTGLLS